MKALNAAALLLVCASLQAQTQLQENVETMLNLPDVSAGGVVYVQSGLFFDTPADIRSFRVDLRDLDSGRNVDIYLRADQVLPPIEELIRDQNGTQVFDPSALVAAADYFSQGSDSEEFLIAQDSVSPTPAGRRWFIGFAIYEGSGAVAITYSTSRAAPTRSTITANFDNPEGDPACDTNPWFDSSPFTPVGNNTATTLGQARRNAMQRALTLIQAELFSPLPVTIAACWENAGGTSGAAGLARARPGAFGLGERSPGDLKEGVLYAQSIVERRGGTDLCKVDPSIACDAPDATIRFNLDVDGPDALGDAGFYYGFTPRAGRPGDADFVSTAIHEIVHGLGFVSLVEGDGALPMITNGTAVDSYTDRLVDNRNGDAVSFASLTDAQRVAAATSLNGLQWSGAASSVGPRNLLRGNGGGLVRMHAPTSFEQGSSISHVSEQYCELMRAINSECAAAPFRSLGITRDMLHEIGWAPGPVIAPYQGLMFDRARNGHGFDLRFAGVFSGTEPVYVMTFYSYETVDGAPEWFQAVGTVRNGVFASLQTVSAPFAEGLVRFVYDPANANVGAGSALVGNVVINFNDPSSAAACNDGVDRSNAAFVHPMSFVIDGEAADWCMEPVVAPGGFPATDLGGLYWAGAEDLGWGFTIENLTTANGTALFVLAYVFAGDNTPVWYFGFVDGFVPGQAITMDLVQRDGFSRQGTFNNNLTDRVAGTLTLNLVSPSGDFGAGNTASINVDYLGPEGGTWTRNNVPIALLLPPRQ